MCSWSGREFDAYAIRNGLRTVKEDWIYDWEIIKQFDPLPFLRDQLILPMGVQWGLKSLSFYLFHDDENYEFDGFDVGLWYELYRKYGETFDVPKVCQYNNDDVTKLKRIVEWVRNGYYELLPLIPLVENRYLKDKIRHENVRMEATRLGISVTYAELLGQKRLSKLQTSDEAIQVIADLLGSKKIHKHIQILLSVRKIQAQNIEKIKEEYKGNSSFIKLINFFNSENRCAEIKSYTLDDLVSQNGMKKKKIEEILDVLVKHKAIRTMIIDLQKHYYIY